MFLQELGIFGIRSRVGRYVAWLHDIMNWLRSGSVVLLLFAIAVGGGPLSVATAHASASHATQDKRPDFRNVAVSSGVQHIAEWAVHSGDHKGLPFIVVDKLNAKAVAFDGKGRLLRTTPVLIGMGVGDTFEPGVLEMDMYATKPHQRITPAGRFYADEDRNDKGERVLWVDYDAGIALHKLAPQKTKQRRHQRMASLNPAEHRITYGCINVPPAFYDQVVHPNFRAKGGFVYVLPDSAPLKAVFNSYDVVERRLSAAEHTVPVRAGSSKTQRF